MIPVILTIHTLIVLALIGVVLLQRSEGGALGMGSGGGGGFMTGRGAANALTRTTSILAALFFATSLGLAIFAKAGESADEVIQELTGDEAPVEDVLPATPTTDDLFEKLGGATDAEGAAIAEPEKEGAPMTEAEILETLGADDAIIEDAPRDEAPAEEDPHQ